MYMAFAGAIRQVVAVLLVAALSTPLLAQNLPTRPPTSSSGSSSVNLDFKFDETLGTTFYIDMLGLEAAKLPFSPEVRVDPNQYIVGPSDLIGVIITGTLSLNYRALGVNVEGDLFLPAIGPVSVAGLTLSEAKTQITEAVGKQFRNVMVDVMLDKPRAMTIHVTGDVPFPGRVSVPYGTRLDVPLMGALLEMSAESTSSGAEASLTKTLAPTSVEIPGLSSQTSSLSTSADDLQMSTRALLESEKWQLRSIRIQRGDEVLMADLHDYYYGGNLVANPLLQDGDRIQIGRANVSDARISLSGAVYMPVDLSYRPDDTLEKLLRMAGGVTSNADTTAISIYRTDRNGTRVISTALDARARQMTLEPNDRIVVSELSKDKLNTRATVLGRAYTTGIFPVRDGVTTAYELLELAGGPAEDALLKGAYIKRADPVDEMGRPQSQENISQLLRSSDQYIQGLNWFEVEEKARKNRIYLNLADEQSLRAVRMYDGDSLFIPRDEMNVFVYGQVDKPGFVQFDGSTTLDDYLRQAGGFSISADPKKVYLIKAGTKTWTDARTATIESGDWIYVDRVPLDDLNQRRLYKVQRQGLLTSALTVLFSAMSTTITILIYYRN